MQEIIASMGSVSVELQDLQNYKCDLSLKLLSSAREHSASDASGEEVVSQLTGAFEEALQFHEVGSNVDFSLGANGGSDMGVTKTNEKNGAMEHGKTLLNPLPSVSVKCLCKSATFPIAESNGTANDSESQDNVSCLRSMSLPVQRKVIPAMKGSREKEGLPLRKLSVSWAPDVYDPIPSSVSHLPKKKNNQQYRNNKKYSKGKSKGKNSRGSSKKDKKRHREEASIGQCKLSIDPIAVTDSGTKFAVDDPPIAAAGTEKIVNFKSTVELLDFDNDIDSPDSNCGSSFLRKSRGTLHFPHAETT